MSIQLRIVDYTNSERMEEMTLYRIRDLREDRDLPQRTIAEYLHISQQQYSKIERGISDITGRDLIRLSQFYHVSVDYVLGLTSNPLLRNEE